MRISRNLIQSAGMMIVLLVVSAACTGCMQIVLPVEFDVTVEEPIDFGDGAAGAPIPSDFAAYEQEVCEQVPTQDELLSDLRQETGDFIINMLTVDALLFEGIVVEALEGDFDSFTEIELSVVMPDGSVITADADPSSALLLPNEDGLVLELKSVEKTDFGTRVAFELEDPIDLVALLDEYGGTEQCVTLTAAVAGTVPEVNPSLKITVKGTFYGSFQASGAS